MFFYYFCTQYKITRMKKRLFSLVAMMFVALHIMSQIPAGETERVTLFKEYAPAVIELTDGSIHQQREANIFLKDASLVYKQLGKDLRANMNIVKTVFINKRQFVNLKNQLAEVIDTCSNCQLLCVKNIDVEAFKGTLLNESDITNISLGDNIAVTRLDPDAESLKFPLVVTYYFVIGGKEVRCHERSVKLVVPKKKRSLYDACIKQYGFDWTKAECLKKVLRVLAE